MASSSDLQRNAKELSDLRRENKHLTSQFSLASASLVKKDHELRHMNEIMEVLKRQVAELQNDRHELQVVRASERVLKESVDSYHRHLKDCPGFRLENRLTDTESDTSLRILSHAPYISPVDPDSGDIKQESSPVPDIGRLSDLDTCTSEGSKQSSLTSATRENLPSRASPQVRLKRSSSPTSIKKRLKGKQPERSVIDVDEFSDDNDAELYKGKHSDRNPLSGFLSKKKEEIKIDESASAFIAQTAHPVLGVPDVAECREALGHLKNPVVGTFLVSELPADVIYSRIRDIGFEIFPIRTRSLILDHLFTREDLRIACGGSPQGTFPKITNGKYTSLHAYKRFMCPILEYNPHAPQIPGAPGLYFALRDPNLWPNCEELLISRYATNKWNVMGLYEIKPSRPLTGEEFRRMPQKVQSTWADNVMKTRWGTLTLAAVHLRRLQRREPSAEEIQEHSTHGKEFLRKAVSQSEVEIAFIRGEERINVWTMKCIGYDEGFKRRLIPDGLLNGGVTTIAEDSDMEVKPYEREARTEFSQEESSDVYIATNALKRQRSLSKSEIFHGSDSEEEVKDSDLSGKYVPISSTTRSRRVKAPKTA